MTFDGFGGHAKYDKYPNPISSSHVKKMKKKWRQRDRNWILVIIRNSMMYRCMDIMCDV